MIDLRSNKEAEKKEEKGAKAIFGPKHCAGAQQHAQRCTRHAGKARIARVAGRT